VIPHNRPTLGQCELDAAARVLAGGWVAQGREVEAFEAEVCAYLGLAAGHAVALSSGTAALFVVLWALGAKGKRVAIPVYSCAAVRNAVIMAGAEAVPVDVADDSPNMDPEQALDASVDMIVAAHMFGVPHRWRSSSLSVPVIEDCSQALGARIDGRPVGTNGTAGVFSFYATKMLTSGGQGGMLVSADKSLADAARDYRQFDCRRDRLPRFNLQMTDLQAAVGRAQLSQLDAFVSRRREIRVRYAAAGLPLWPAATVPGIEPCNFRAITRAPNPPAAIAQLAETGIRAIVPIADWELLAEPGQFPRAAALARSTVSLPIYPSLTQQETATVIRGALTPAPLATLESL
jgi:perosamine synthetase